MTGTVVKRTLTRQEWEAEGERRFGKNKMDWKFVCPVCGHVASVRDYQAAGAPEGAVGFSCVGRYLKESPGVFLENKASPCNYAGGGLFRMNPVLIVDKDADNEHTYFDFA